MNFTFLQNYIFRKIDRSLFGSIFLILIIGLINLTSANQQDAPQTLSQIFNIIIGVSFFYLICNIKTRIILSFAPWAYLISIVLLILVNSFGIESHGAKRWIDLGPINFQPSELMKINHNHYIRNGWAIFVS